MRIFVDCDDTLILWLDEEGQPLEGQNPYGGGSQKWLWNEALIRALREIEDEIVIWSGGGRPYAQTWRERLQSASSVVAEWSMSKDTRIPQPDDLCIDDMPIQVACPVMTWQEFVTEHGP